MQLWIREKKQVHNHSEEFSTLAQTKCLQQGKGQKQNGRDICKDEVDEAGKRKELNFIFIVGVKL